MEDNLASFLERFFKPQFVGAFHGPTVRVAVFRTAGQEAATEIISLHNFYPFLTFTDLKTAIYMEKKKDPDFYPSFQCLLVPDSSEPFENQQDMYIPADFLWLKPGGSADTDIYTLHNPFHRAASGRVDERFVTAAGEKQVIGFVSKGRTTLESADPFVIQFHLYLYKDALNTMTQALRSSEREWYGRMGPYFPELEPLKPVEALRRKEVEQSDLRITYVKKTIQLLRRIDQLIDGEVELLPMGLGGIKFLRLVWKKPEEATPELETLFYQTTVTAERPFLRILPSDTQPITKIRLLSALKIPDISDPRLLLQWAQERNPTPEKDYVFAKLVIRKTLGTQPALYGTLRLFEDKSSDFILLPPKQLRRLEPKSDLSQFPGLFTKGIEGLPLETQSPEIGEATLICGIRLPQSKPRITRAIFRKRLAAFSCAFQEISPLPGEQPLAMLRYKLVSNFSTEDRIYGFLTQLASRRLLHGDAVIGEFSTAIAEEFQLQPEEAQSKVADWLRSSGEASLVVPETKDYIMTYNKGIDIGIFAQHPFYSFHLYRVDSIQSLERILTLLSLLFSADDEFLVTSERFAAEYGVAAAAAATSPPGAAPIAAAVVAAPVAAAAAVAPPVATATAAAAAAEDDDVEDLGDLEFDPLMFAAEEGNEEEDEEEGGVAARVAAAAEPPKREVEAALPMPVAAAPVIASRPTATAAVAANENNNSDKEDNKEKRYDKYLIRKLQDADRHLFEYKATTKDVKIKKYVSMCQATETRQPAVLTQEQYERMREEYADDDVIFQVYPLEQDEEEPQEGAETYTLLKYGSDPLRQNYYLCCEYFCTNDYILVRESDLRKEVDRKGKKKPKDSCPFCHGLIIKDLKKPTANQTIIHRKVKQKSKDNKRHLYVRFLKETNHPDGFYQPCCFIDNKTIRVSDKQFEHIRAAAQGGPVDEDGDEREEADAEADAEAEGPVSAGTAAAVPMMDYQVTLAKAHRKYIVGPEKFPLKLGEIDGPQIGLLFPSLDAYFGQNPTDFVSREFNRMELKPDSKAFLRIGVENRSRYLPDSFLAAIAPVLFLNSAEQVKARLQQVITPRIFLFLNYGNFVLEFYKPSDPVPQDAELRLWVFRELEIDMTNENKDAVVRLWKSYHRFQGFVESSSLDALKQYRHFAQVLALPRLVTPRGFVCIILDINDKDEVDVRCPPYGYDVEQYAGSDIVFLLHHHSGIWEPIFYTDNRRATSRFPESHEPTLLFQRAIEGAWPPIVRNRVREFVSKCVSSGRGAYTSQSRINPMALIPLGRAIQAMEKSPAGIVRDAYNHIAALTFRSRPGKPGLVALPVIDDGTIIRERKIHLDWDDYDRAPIDEAIEYYTRDFDSIFSLYPGYKVERKVRSRTTGKFIALQLGNGIYIPVKDPRDPAKVDGLPIVEVDQMEWSLNREFTYSSGKEERLPEEQLLMANENEMNEVFEHLRLTFSNWFSSEEAGPEFRKQIESILFERKHDVLNPPLPLFEKRKRLEILLAPVVLEWLDQSEDNEDRQQIASLLRVDCRLRAEASCSGICSWRQNEGQGRCLLHSPKRAHLGSREVNGPQLLFMRLLEELLRFPERRRQLLKGDVSTLVSIKEAIKIDDQWILPEGSVAWFDLLRLDWMPSGKEKKKFFEEMSANPSGRPAYQDDVAPSQVLPPALVQLLGPEDEKVRGIFLYRAAEAATLLPYLTALGTSSVELGMPEEADSLSREAIKRLVRIVRHPVILIDLRTAEPTIMAYSNLREQKGGIPYIIVVTPEGPALLSSSALAPKAILPDAMPAGLLQIYQERTPIGDIRVGQ